jgi:hypothetical protein
MTQTLTPDQWFAVFALAVAVMVVIEVEKWIRNRTTHVAPVEKSPEAILTGTSKPADVHV